MRVKDSIVDIDYVETKEFFAKRATKYKEESPYSVTMYQDNNAELVRERNEYEIQKLKPMLKLDSYSRVLDVACGIGRWADAISEEIEEYCGLDFSEELIAIASKRNSKEKFYFHQCEAMKVERLLQEKKMGKYNIILLMGILMYINDRDLHTVFEQLINICEKNARICIREPLGLDKRLTLKDFYSEELQESYNAIYRTRDELLRIFEQTFFQFGFRIESEGYLFEEQKLNNRRDTSQYYFILKR